MQTDYLQGTVSLHRLADDRAHARRRVDHAFSGDRDSPVYEAHAKTLSQEVRDRWKGHWTQRSTDSGLTWEEPVSFAIETSAVGADLLSDFRHPVIE